MLCCACSCTTNVGLELDGFYSDVQFDEVEVSGSLNAGGTTGDEHFDDSARRQRYGIRAIGGRRGFSGYVNLFAERFELNDTSPTSLNTAGSPDLNFPLEFGMFGFGAGVAGTPRLAAIGDDPALLLKYRFGINHSSGDTGSTDIEYVEAEGELGIGVEFGSWRSVVGFAPSLMSGNIENQFRPDFDGYHDETGFAELRYQPESLPIFGEVRALFGDQQGVQIMFGANF